MTFLAEDEPSVCVEDFCGRSMPGGFPTTFSADYYPRLGITCFSGEWCDVPDMPSTEAPDETAVWRWATDHGWTP